MPRILLSMLNNSHGFHRRVFHRPISIKGCHAVIQYTRIDIIVFGFVGSRTVKINGVEGLKKVTIVRTFHYKLSNVC